MSKINFNYILQSIQYLKLRKDRSFLNELYKIDCLRSPHDKEVCISVMLKEINSKSTREFFKGTSKN